MSRHIHPFTRSVEGDVDRQQRLLSTSRLLDHEAFISDFHSWEGPSIGPNAQAPTGPIQPTDSAQPIARNLSNDKRP